MYTHFSRSVVRRLKRKYGPGLEDILNFKENLSGTIENLEQKERSLETLKDNLRALASDMVSGAAVLSRKRKQAAKRLEKSIEAELGLLDMSGTRFEVRFHDVDPGVGDDRERSIEMLRSDGFDMVEFMLAPNPGEELRPLSRIASGGELSRIMLAVKTILARTASVESIIFDEVDSGIGGATAEVVGEKLRSLAEYHQVLCITHLPQIASKGETHFLVKKSVEKKRTRTTISELDPERRIREIARLLAGRVISEQAVAHAKEMLR